RRGPGRDEAGDPAAVRRGLRKRDEGHPGFAGHLLGRRGESRGERRADRIRDGDREAEDRDRSGPLVLPERLHRPGRPARPGQLPHPGLQDRERLRLRGAGRVRLRPEDPTCPLRRGLGEDPVRKTGRRDAAGHPERLSLSVPAGRRPGQDHRGFRPGPPQVPARRSSGSPAERLFYRRAGSQVHILRLQAGLRRRRARGVRPEKGGESRRRTARSGTGSTPP
ncbi:MAG: hypothetical protein H6P96_745, partial [Candidatus Aminicenantes bacterium]|nr:hypothetical protein [Candidatus Aminicenantes bacterium]